MKKRVKRADLKYTDMSQDVLLMVEELNKKDNTGALWLINMRFSEPGMSPRKLALRQIIFSLGKLMNTNNAEEVFKGVADRLGTAPYLIERQLRGMDNVEVITQCGQNYIEFR